MDETPIYILKQSVKRALIPKMLTLLILGIIFYLGILLNITLLDLTGEEETVAKTISLIIVILIVALGIFLAYLRAERSYKFYRTKIRFGKNYLDYRDIVNTTPKTDWLDKRFRTHSIILGNDFALKHISDTIDLESYLRQLIVYSQGR